MKAPLRPARHDESAFVQTMLAQAVDELLDPTSDFAKAEKARFRTPFMRALMEADPAYVVIVEAPDKQPAGFIIGVPELGHIVMSWAYILPAFRKGTLAMRALNAYVRHWDHGQFHKVVYYTLPGNQHSDLIGRHAGFEKVALLRHHFGGLDVVLYEKHYSKDKPGYAPYPVIRGIRGRLAAKVRNLLGRKPV